jgi:hypothetical protein
VHEPRKFSERRELEDLQAARTVHKPGRRETQRARGVAFAD